MKRTVKVPADVSMPNDISTVSIGSASSVLPEANVPRADACSHTGVSTRNVPNRTITSCSEPQLNIEKHWYALRTTYGREKKAYNYIITHGGTAFYPTIITEKEQNGKKKLVEVSRLPNIFFAYGTEEDIQAFVYDNYNLPFLRFYYKHTHVGSRVVQTPLIVPDNQMRTLRIICGVEAGEDTMIVADTVRKFQEGERVHVLEGQFKGVEGIVARFKGQQRVGIVIKGLLTAITAYVPSAFLSPYPTTAKNDIDS